MSQQIQPITPRTPQSPRIPRLALVSAALSALLVACGGGGGGGDDSSGGPGGAQAQITTIATSASDGTARRVDLVPGPIAGGDPANAALNTALQGFLNTLMSRSGVDIDRDLADINADGVPDTGFDTYLTGMNPVQGSARRIFGANNLYDLFQTSTNQTPGQRPLLVQPMSLGGALAGPPFNGGDGNGDGLIDGGPGLFSNLNMAGGPGNPMPSAPVLPNAMGDRDPVTQSARGPSPTDQHQFIQIEFPFPVSLDSLRDPFNPGNSFLGDQLPGELNVIVERRWVTRSPMGTANAQYSVIDHTFEHAHVPGVAILGGQAFVPGIGGQPTEISLALSNLPEAAKEKVMDPRVLTYIAHENPAGISTVPTSDLGFINPDNVLILPDPTDMTGKGGRVFGGSQAVPSSVNDFASDGVGMTSDANRIGFFTFKITRVRSKGKTINDVYFHTFPVSQAFVGMDAASVGTFPGGTNGTFNRGPAIEVDSVTRIPAIEVANPNQHYLGSFTLTPASDTENTISTKTRFRVDFDKEVVPNSVGFSRRHTIHSVAGMGVVFEFNGNTRPIQSPASEFLGGVQGAPLAPSIYLAVNQPTQVGVNNPQSKNANVDPTLTDAQANGNGVFVGSPTVNGLFPAVHNSLAQLPRGVVPCDIYPVNQNNLQAYIVEPLVPLPPQSIVTLGVCMQGLGTSNNSLPPTVPAVPTNHGNYTRSGTMTTPWQALTPLGLGNPAVSLNLNIIGNATIVKVNAGPMDLQGLLFFGGTETAIDTLINAQTFDDQSDGGWNVSRTFRVGTDLADPYVNAPVAPQAIVVGFQNKGLGVVDLAGTGLTTNAPGGAASNAGFQNTLITTRFIPPLVSGQMSLGNWSANGSLASGSHQRGFGVMGRYTSGNCLLCTPASIESEFAIGAPIRMGAFGPIGPGRIPGVNEGSSGYETMVRDSSGSIFLSDNKIGLVNDILLGDFLDTVYFDPDNLFANDINHSTYNTPLSTSVPNNTIADPPTPNPPPLRLPVGLPLTAVVFDQSDLSQPPVLIEGSEVFGRDRAMDYDDGSGISPFSYPLNTFIHLNPTSNTSNPNSFDVPYLPAAGFPSPFQNETGVAPSKFLQTGPIPRTSTAGAVVLVNLNTNPNLTGPFEPGGLIFPPYQARQQIGNFLFVTDGINKKLHAVNSNTMDVIRSLALPDPTGLGMTSDLSLLYVSNQGDNSVSVVDADPESMTFMTEINRIDVGEGPRAVAVAPDNEDVFVLNRLGNTVSIISVGSSAVRRTLAQSGINRPNDVTMGMIETNNPNVPAFQSGTYHGFITNGGSDSVLVYESGPAGLAGIGFDNILGAIPESGDTGQVPFAKIDDPRGVCFDPAAPLDPFARTIGAFVAHRNADTGQAMISRVAYTKDSNPGQETFNINNVQASLGEKVFEIIQQYQSTASGIAYDVAIADYNRKRLENSDFGTNYNLFNAGAIEQPIGAVVLPRNNKYPLATWTQPVTQNGPRWDPDRVYLSVQGGIIEVFDIVEGSHEKTILTPGGEPTVLATYFGQ